MHHIFERKVQIILLDKKPIKRKSFSNNSNETPFNKYSEQMKCKDYKKSSFSQNFPNWKPSFSIFHKLRSLQHPPPHTRFLAEERWGSHQLQWPGHNHWEHLAFSLGRGQGWGGWWRSGSGTGRPGKTAGEKITEIKMVRLISGLYQGLNCDTKIVLHN